MSQPLPPGFSRHPVYQDMAANEAGAIVREFARHWRPVKPFLVSTGLRINAKQPGDVRYSKVLAAEFILEAHGRFAPDRTFRPYPLDGRRDTLRLSNLEWRVFTAGNFRLRPIGSPTLLRRCAEDDYGKVREYTVLDSTSVRALFNRFTTTEDSVATIALSTKLSYDTVRKALSGRSFRREREVFGKALLDIAAIRRGVAPFIKASDA